MDNTLESMYIPARQMQTSQDNTGLNNELIWALHSICFTASTVIIVMMFYYFNKNKRDEFRGTVAHRNQVFRELIISEFIVLIVEVMQTIQFLIDMQSKIQKEKQEMFNVGNFTAFVICFGLSVLASIIDIAMLLNELCGKSKDDKGVYKTNVETGEIENFYCMELCTIVMLLSNVGILITSSMLVRRYDFETASGFVWMVIANYLEVVISAYEHFDLDAMDSTEDPAELVLPRPILEPEKLDELPKLYDLSSIKAENRNQIFNWIKSRSEFYWPEDREFEYCAFKKDFNEVKNRYHIWTCFLQCRKQQWQKTRPVKYFENDTELKLFYSGQIHWTNDEGIEWQPQGRGILITHVLSEPSKLCFREGMFNNQGHLDMTQQFRFINTTMFKDGKKVSDGVFHNSQAFTVNSDPILGVSEMVPSVDQLMALSASQMSEQSIESIMHHTSNMGYFTLKFNDGSIVPKTNTYQREPSVQIKLPDHSQISSIAFKTFKNPHGYINLQSMTVDFFKGKEILKIMPADRGQYHHETQKVDLKRGEQIVAARIDVNKTKILACVIELIIYDPRLQRNERTIDEKLPQETD